ncbi:hypothetical protein ABIB38_000913 [Massilia sp. UYP11]|uniref:hypothetical protein n=1 Tax=Massilia sp. UYP11 TaxID=1756385 RepID=UPI003D1D061F
MIDTGVFASASTSMMARRRAAGKESGAYPTTRMEHRSAPKAGRAFSPNVEALISKLDRRKAALTCADFRYSRDSFPRFKLGHG